MRLSLYDTQNICLVPCPMPKRDQRFPVFRGIFVSTWIINLGWLANHTCNSGMPIRCSLHDVIVLSTRFSLFSRVYSFCPFPDCTSIASRGKKGKKEQEKEKREKRRKTKREKVVIIWLIIRQHLVTLDHICRISALGNSYFSKFSIRIDRNL